MNFCSFARNILILINNTHTPVNNMYNKWIVSRYVQIQMKDKWNEAKGSIKIKEQKTNGTAIITIWNEQIKIQITCRIQRMPHFSWALRSFFSIECITIFKMRTCVLDAIEKCMELNEVYLLQKRTYSKQHISLFLFASLFY